MKTETYSVENNNALILEQSTTQQTLLTNTLQPEANMMKACSFPENDKASYVSITKEQTVT